MPIRYHVAIDGAVRDVSIVLRPGSAPTVHVDGVPVAADVSFVPGGVNLLIDGVVYDVQTGGSTDGMKAVVGPHHATVSVQRDRGVPRKSQSVREGEIEVRAPMPGRVVEVHVAVGDEVAANQALVVVEAMKMQNELRASNAGTVTAVEVSAGRTVERGALLVRISSSRTL